MDQREAKNAVVALIGENGIAAAHAPITSVPSPFRAHATEKHHRGSH